MPFKPTKYRDPQEMTRDEMVRELKDLRSEIDMYANAWLRELGDKIFPKTHTIDALVKTTRWMRERSERLAVYEEREKHAAMSAEYGPHIREIVADRVHKKNIRRLPVGSTEVKA